MKLLVIVLLLVLTSFVDCRSTTCGDRIAIYGRAEICAVNKWCHSGTWSHGENVFENFTARASQYEETTYVKIFPDLASYSVKSCSVQNFQQMVTIYGENTGIKYIEINAFWNLPALENIYLAFNSLKEIQFGVFNNLTVNMLDLSWNKIGFVGEKAFEGMEKLQVLNLSHNEIATFDLKSYKDLPLKELIMSYNNLKYADIGPDLNVTSLDFSFNELHDFKLYYNKMYKKIDLTSNYLSSLTWDGGSVEEFILPLNNLSDINVLLRNISIGNITLFPNPWDCTKLDLLLKSLEERNCTITNPNVDQRLNFVYKDYPICAILNSYAYNNYRKLRKHFIRREERTCKNDNQCSSAMICRTGTCWDPCIHNACRSATKRCETKNHVFSCKCPLGRLPWPYTIFSECYIPCFLRKDCPNPRAGGAPICYNNFCIE